MLKRKSDDDVVDMMEEEEEKECSSQPNKKRCAGAAAEKMSPEAEGAAIAQRKQITLATTRLLSQLTMEGVDPLERLIRFSVAWNDIDVNFVNSDGQWLPAALLAVLRRFPAVPRSAYNAGFGSMFVGFSLASERKSRVDACHAAIISALLKYERPADRPDLTLAVFSPGAVGLVERVQPRDADHLLFLYACELLPSIGNVEVCDLVHALIRTLNERAGDAKGRAAFHHRLLFAAAMASFRTDHAAAIFSMLVTDGAEPHRWRNEQGHCLMRVCAEHTAAQLTRLDPWQFEPEEWLVNLKRALRVLALYGADTADDDGITFWFRLARSIRDSPPQDEQPEPEHNITSLVAETVLHELLDIHAKDPNAFPIRGRHAALLLHHVAASRRAPFTLNVLIEGLGGWRGRALPLDIHVRDEQGRTLQEVIEQTYTVEERGPELRFILAQLVELRRQWLQHERPFVQRQLSEQTDLPPELCDLFLSFVDGLNHKGERDVGDDRAKADHESGTNGGADGEEVEAGL